jgi:hypothetical protein
MMWLLAGSQVQIYSGKPRPVNDSLGDSCRRTNRFPERGSIEYWLVLRFCQYPCGDKLAIVWCSQRLYRDERYFERCLTGDFQIKQE